MRGSSVTGRTSNKIIFLDMDGVCADFVSGAARAHGKDLASITWPRGCYDIASVFGVSNREFAGKIKIHRSPFWSDLDPYPWLDEMLLDLGGLGRIVFVSSLGPFGAAAASGKLLWLRTYVGREAARDAIFVTADLRHRLAGQDAILIDDNELTVREFIRAGGYGVVFPQPWNSSRFEFGWHRSLVKFIPAGWKR
jgi:hypothetical protein